MRSSSRSRRCLRGDQLQRQRQQLSPLGSGSDFDVVAVDGAEDRLEFGQVVGADKAVLLEKSCSAGAPAKISNVFAAICAPGLDQIVGQPGLVEHLAHVFVFGQASKSKAGPIGVPNSRFSATVALVL